MTDHLSHPLHRSIVLIGLMGAGKSAIGRRLAALLKLPLKDADTEIENAAGCSVDDIFETYGEAAFRDCERRVIARLLDDGVKIIATGGGAFIDAETRARIGDLGISVWLRADIEVLLRRTSRRNNRPLLKRGDPREILTQLIAERYPIYAEADIVVDSRDIPAEQTVAQVVDGLETWLATPANSESLSR